MGQRPKIPIRVQKALFQEANSRCPVCSESNINVLTIHHIVDFAEVPVHDPANLIVLCANCHARAQSREISQDELFAKKKQLSMKISDAEARNINGFDSKPAHRVSGTIAAGRDVNIGRDVVFVSDRTRKTTSSVLVPGTVAQDKWKVGYLKYLGHRFNKFKEAEMKKSGLEMKSVLIWTNYRDEMKFKVEQTPLELFEQGVNFLKRRIDGTKIGRIRKSRGQKNYRDFPEYVALGEK